MIIWLITFKNIKCKHFVNYKTDLQEAHVIEELSQVVYESTSSNKFLSNVRVQDQIEVPLTESRFLENK